MGCRVVCLGTTLIAMPVVDGPNALPSGFPGRRFEGKGNLLLGVTILDATGLCNCCYMRFRLGFGYVGDRFPPHASIAQGAVESTVCRERSAVCPIWYVRKPMSQVLLSDAPPKRRAQPDSRHVLKVSLRGKEAS